MEELYLCIPLIGCLSVVEQFYLGIALVFLGGVIVGGVAVILAARPRASEDASHIRRDESGNIFFMLFGAVALVGVIGASTMQIANGPVRTMAEVTKRTVAENNMIAGARLAIITSTTLQADSGDCDADGFVEPFPSRNPGGASAPSGGGLLPSEVAIAKLDPWQNEYGYCVWDHGPLSVSDDVAGCGGATARRLEGGNLNTQYALALISSGPDRVFQTSCNDWVDVAPADGEPDVPLLVKVSGSDDIVLGHTYAEASALGGGLWKLKEGAPDTAAIEKDLEVTGGMEMSGALNLLSQGLILPGDPGDDSITGACSAVNDQQLRRNTSTSPPTIEICDVAGSGNWEAARGIGLWKSSGNDIYYDDGDVSLTGSGNFEYWFDNTNDGSAGIDTAWRLISNDGTGNFHTYINSTGSSSPVYETDGTAYHEGYSPGQDTYAFQGAVSGTAGGAITWQDIMALDLANARAGIGTTSPSEKLDVAGSISLDEELRLRDPGGNWYTFNERDSSNYPTGIGLRPDTNPNAGDVLFSVQSTGGSNRFYVQQSGYIGTDDNDLWIGGTGDSYFAGDVGIGTSSPAYALDVNGDIRARSGYYRGDEANEYIHFQASDDSIRFYTQNNLRMTLANTGELTVTGEVDANIIRTNDFGGDRWCKANSFGRIFCDKNDPGGGSPSCTTRTKTNGANDSTESKSCNSGETRTGGGCNCSGSGGFFLRRSYPSGSGSWTCKCAGGADSTTAYVVCCTF